METAPITADETTHGVDLTRSNEEAERDGVSLRDRLVRLAYRFLWNRDDAEEVVQDVLAAAHSGRWTLRRRERRWSWLCRAVVNACHTHGRRKRRWEKHVPWYAAALRARTPEPTNEPAETQEIIRSLLLLLPPRQKEVVVLRHLEGMSYERIADVLDISPATARVHAHAGLETLREKAVERFPGWPATAGPESKG